MAEEIKKEQKGKKKLWPFLLGGVAVVAAAATVILLATGGSHSDLYNKLAADGTATIEINEDVTSEEMLVVNGDKTLVGNGTIYAKGNTEYAIVISPSAKLTINGPSVDCEDGATNGIYTSEQATLTHQDGSIKNMVGHGVRDLGTATFEGGNIESAGTNWLMVDENATVDITDGEFSDAGEIGIIAGNNSTLNIGGTATLDTALENLVYSSGNTNIDGGTYTGHLNYAFYNSGVMNIKNVTMQNAKGLGYVQNVSGARMDLKDVSFLGSKTDYIYNQGIFTGENITLGDCKNSAIENSGSKANMTIKNLTAGEIGSSFINNKSSIANMENVKIDKVGAYVCHNRAAYLTLKEFEVGEVGGSAFLNNYVDSKSTTSIGDLTLENFKIGKTASNGIRSNGGNVKITNGTIDVCQNHALYIKDGKFNAENVKFLGAADTKVVAQVGYKTSLKAEATFKNCDFTGGARGIYNYAIVDIDGCNFHDITAGGSFLSGPGLKNAGTMTIKNTKFTNLTSLSSSGAVYNTGKLTMEGNTISGCKAVKSGGGISNTKTGTLYYKSGTITGCSAGNYAGAIYNSGKISISGGSFTGNHCSKGGGAFENTGTASVTGGSFSNNTSGIGGGGIYNGSKGTMTLSGVTVSGNRCASDKSAGGIYNLGTMTFNSGSVTYNTAGTYGGGISNGVSSSGAVGKLTINGGNFNNNTAIANAGGALYNRGTCTINGGNFNGNSINSEKNGKNIYNSGNLYMQGGTANDKSEKPYDIYTYKGDVSFSGSPNVGSIYKANDSTVTIAGKITSPSQINFYMSSYIFNTKAFHGSSSNIAASKNKFNLMHHDVSTDGSSTSLKYVDNNGVIVAPYANEVELWRNGEKLATTSLKVAAEASKDGDTIVVIGDIYVGSYVSLSQFSKSAIDTHKTLYIKGDGGAHTITIDSGSNAGFYIAASSGDGGTGTSESGYYRSSVDVNWDATNLTFQGTGDMGSAAFLVSGPSTFSVTNGTFQNFSNVATESSEDSHSSGKNGAVMSVGASASVNITGSTFKNNSNDGSGGAAIYNSGRIVVDGATFVNNKAQASNNKNGGAIYVTSTGMGTVVNSLFEGNSAYNAGAIYIYGGQLSINRSTFKNNIAESSDSTAAESIYVTATTGDTKKYANLSLGNDTIEGAKDTENGVVVRAGNKLYIEGKQVIDSLVVYDLPVRVFGLTSDSDLHIVIPSDDYTAGTKVFTGDTVGINAKVKVNDGQLTVNDDGELEGFVARVENSRTSEQYETLKAAVEAAEAGDTLKLVADQEVDTSEAAGVVITKKLTVDLNGKTLTSKGKYYIFRCNSGADLTVLDSAGKGVIQPGEGSYPGRAINVNGGQATLASGKITGGVSTSTNGGGAVSIGSSGTFNMTGGLIEGNKAKYNSSTEGGKAGAINVEGTFNFSGGEIKNNTQEDGHYAIEGSGTFNVSKDALVGDTFNVTTTALTGGYYKTDVTSQCATGYLCQSSTEKAGYSYKVVKDPSAEPVAKIGTTEYATLSEAFNTVKSGETITLLKDVTITAPMATITSGKTVTFDLAGHKVTGIGTSASSTAARFITNEGTFNIVDSVGGSEFKNFGPATTCNGAIWNKGTLNVQGVTMNVSEYKNGAAIYNGTSDNDSTTNITGGHFNCSSSTATMIFAYKGTVNISGGFFKGVVSAGTNGKLVISGGYFDSNVAAANIAEGYKCVTTTEYAGYGYKVVSSDPEASVDGTEYSTFEEAWTAATTSGGTIKLLKDVDDSAKTYTVGSAVDVKIDLAGCTLKVDKIGTSDASAKLSVISDGKLDLVTGLDAPSGEVLFSAGEIVLPATSSFANLMVTGTARIDCTDATVLGAITITGGYFKTDVSTYVGTGYKCQASTKYEGYDYEVISTIPGIDLEPTDPFDEETQAPE